MVIAIKINIAGTPIAATTFSFRKFGLILEVY